MFVERATMGMMSLPIGRAGGREMEASMVGGAAAMIGLGKESAGLSTSPAGVSAQTATAASAPAGMRSLRAPDPDALLVREHIAGDPKAFECLFRKYQTPIFNLVTRMVRGEDAYDLTQDVFLKAYKHLRTFRGDAKFSTWLFTIARHTCLNHLRHKSVIGEDSLEEAQEDHPATNRLMPR